MARRIPTHQFLLLPTRGLRAYAAPMGAGTGRFLADLARSLEAGREPAVITPGAERGGQLRVLDSVHEDGAKLVEMSDEALSSLRSRQPGLRIVPLLMYRTAVAPRVLPIAAPRIAAARAARKAVIRVVSGTDGRPVARANVVAFTNFTERVGAQGNTNGRGETELSFDAATRKIERLYVFPVSGFWPSLRKDVAVSPRIETALVPLDLGYSDALRHFYGVSPADMGTGVTVGIVDTGIAIHPDLVVAGGQNTVVGEDPADWMDNGEGHGTHVAGIVAGRGTPPTGMRGIASHVALRSYRVFGKKKAEASNYAIIKAIDRAVADGCDLINLSLGGGPRDPALSDAIADARAQGSLVIAAAGNDGRQPVSFPASDSLAIAVSAMGRKGTFPKASAQEGDVKAPYGTDRKDFVAAFSNIGAEIDLTAPGVGIMSTYPGGYAVLDGTSMACPAATGAAARLLSGRLNILSMPRSQERSDAMAQALLEAAGSLGFGAIYEGRGMVR